MSGRYTTKQRVSICAPIFNCLSTLVKAALIFALFYTEYRICHFSLGSECISQTAYQVDQCANHTIHVLGRGERKALNKRFLTNFRKFLKFLLFIFQGVLQRLLEHALTICTIYSKWNLGLTIMMI